MLTEILDLGTWIVPFILFIGCTAIYIFRNIKESYQKIIYTYLLLSLFFDLSSRYWSYRFQENLNFIALFALVELILFYLFYYLTLLPKLKILGLIPAILLFIYIVLDIVNIKIETVLHFQTYTRCLSSIYIVVSSIVFYFYMLKDTFVEKQILKLNAIILLYFSLNFIFYLPINFIVNVPLSISLLLWLFNLFLLVFFYFYLLTHLWRYGKIKKQSFFG